MCRIYSFTSIGMYINLRWMTNSFQDVVWDFRNNETNARLARRDKTTTSREPAHKNEVERSWQNWSVSYNLHQSSLSKINSNSPQQWRSTNKNILTT